MCDPNSHSKPPDVQNLNLGSHLEMKRLGTNQNCNVLSSHVRYLPVVSGSIHAINQDHQHFVTSFGPLCY